MRFLLASFVLLALLPAAGSTAVSPPSPVSRKLASRLFDLPRSQRNVRVVVEASGGAQAAALAAERLGGKVEARYRDLVQVRAPVSSLAQLAASPAVSFVRPPLLHVAAAVTGQEVSASGASSVQASGLTGRGVKIAIIDLGFAGFASAVASGELPPDAEITSFCGPADQYAHGTAVAEIVHDMAPDAQLYLLCIDSEATLGRAVDWVYNQGIPLINHSITWLSGGRGDGVNNRFDRTSPDTIAKRAFDRGILWVGAAGNFAQSHWSGPFSDPNHNSWQNFTGADEGNAFTIPAGETACASLVWDDWPQSDQDFNLYLFSTGDSRELAASENVQRPNALGTPSEEVCYTNNQAFPLSVYAAIKAIPPATTQRFDLFVTQGNLQYDVPQGSVAQPAESPWVLGVGAVCWKGYAVRPYSSQGPTIDGRLKPDLVSYDGISTKTFGLSANCDDGFLGTSAATPSVTGAAALILQQRPELAGHPADFMAAVEAKTADLGGNGKDNLFGWGRLCLASCTAPPPPPPPPPPPGPPPPPPGPPPVKLKLVRFVTSPKHSKAGRAFAAAIEVTRADTGARVRAGRVLCAAKLGRIHLRVRAAGFRRGLARCKWRIPGSARGKLLRGSVGLSYRGLRIERPFAQRVG